MPKWVYPLAFAFLVFYIYNDASNAGIVGHSFVDFIGTILDAVGDFITAFSNPDTPNSVDPQSPTTFLPTLQQTTLPTIPETVTLTTQPPTP